MDKTDVADTLVELDEVCVSDEDALFVASAARVHGAHNHDNWPTGDVADLADNYLRGDERDKHASTHPHRGIVRLADFPYIAFTSHITHETYPNPTHSANSYDSFE